MPTTTPGITRREQLLKRMLHERVERLMVADVSWIDDLGVMDTPWTKGIVDIRQFKDAHFHGFYKYHHPTLSKTAIVKYTEFGIFELSKETIGDKTVITYGSIKAEGGSMFIKRTATFTDFTRFLRKFK